MSEEIRVRLGQLVAEFALLSRRYRRDEGRLMELAREIEKLEAELERERPKPSETELRRAELERALREARGKELALLRSLQSPFADWNEYRKRRELYEEASRQREELEQMSERR